MLWRHAINSCCSNVRLQVKAWSLKNKLHRRTFHVKQALNENYISYFLYPLPQSHELYSYKKRKEIIIFCNNITIPTFLTSCTAEMEQKQDCYFLPGLDNEIMKKHSWDQLYFNTLLYNCDFRSNALKHSQGMYVLHAMPFIKSNRNRSKRQLNWET